MGLVAELDSTGLRRICRLPVKDVGSVKRGRGDDLGR
jgi:hypothetical protein